MKKLPAALRHFSCMKPVTFALGLVVGLAVTTAQAGFVVTHPSFIPEDSNYPYFETGSFNFDPAVRVTGSGVLSGASYMEARNSLLPTGPGGSPEKVDLLADTGLITTTQSGKGVRAYAAIDNLPGSPSLARTTLFNNHAYANTRNKYEFTNSGEVTIQDRSYQARSLYQRDSSRSTAQSGWYDVWTAQAQQQAELKLHLDGEVLDPLYCTAGCGLGYPLGTDTFRPAAGGIGFSAMLAVYDMDSVVPCGFGNQYWCGRPFAFPVHITEVNYSPNSGDTFPLVPNQDLVASFETQVGHRYLAIGTVSITSVNGAELDFYNTISLSVKVPLGTLYSDGLGGADLGAHFSQPVPEPGSLALCVAGLLGLLLRTQRRRNA